MDFFSPDLDHSNLPRYLPSDSLASNVRRLAEPLWGDGHADWAADLATDMSSVLPEHTAESGGGAAAGVLCAAAVECGVVPSSPLWHRLLADITAMTAVSPAEAVGNWAWLVDKGWVPALPPQLDASPDEHDYFGNYDSEDDDEFDDDNFNGDEAPEELRPRR